jgi:hypothetical protein
MPDTTSVVAIGAKKCKPFIIEVMVFSPESGFKIEVSVEKACTATNDAIWKIVFDLYKKKAAGDGFDQLVHVSYRGKTTDENSNIAKTLHGVTSAQADTLVKEVFPASKAFSDDQSDENKAKVASASKNFVAAADL